MAINLSLVFFGRVNRQTFQKTVGRSILNHALSSLWLKTFLCLFGYGQDINMPSLQQFVSISWAPVVFLPILNSYRISIRRWLVSASLSKFPGQGSSGMDGSDGWATSHEKHINWRSCWGITITAYLFFFWVQWLQSEHISFAQKQIPENNKNI